MKELLATDETRINTEGQRAKSKEQRAERKEPKALGSMLPLSVKIRVNPWLIEIHNEDDPSEG